MCTLYCTVAILAHPSNIDQHTNLLNSLLNLILSGLAVHKRFYVPDHGLAHITNISRNWRLCKIKLGRKRVVTRCECVRGFSSATEANLCANCTTILEKIPHMYAKLESHLLTTYYF